MKFSSFLGLLGAAGYTYAACANAWAQCGGQGFNGESCCVSGYTCKVYNAWYSQCLPGGNTGAATPSTTTNPSYNPPAQTTTKTLPTVNTGTSSSNYPKGNGFQFYTQCKNPKHWAMSYDDGPYLYDDSILDLMKEKGVKATFFVTGNLYQNINSDASQRSLKRMYAEGHVIGNHSWSHKDLTSLSASQIQSEMKQVEDGIYKAIGKKPAFMRPPYGSGNGNANMMNTLKSLGYTAACNWNVDPMDYSNGGDINYALSAFGGKVGQGVISLNHLNFGGANAQNIVALSKAEIEFMLSKGYKSVTMEECLGISAYQ